MKHLRRNQKDRMCLGEGQTQQSPGNRQAHIGYQPSSLTVAAARGQTLTHTGAPLPAARSQQSPLCNSRQIGGQDEVLYTRLGCSTASKGSPRILAATAGLSPLVHMTRTQLLKKTGETITITILTTMCLHFFFFLENSPNFPASLG